MTAKLRLSPPVHVNEPRDPRHNALVHGLTANFPLDDHEHQVLAEEIDLWTKELGPCCEAETALIHAAAIARVRVVRCARADSAAIRQARRRAEADHQAKERARARKLAASLPADPIETRQRLEASRYGREYLAGRWRALDATANQGLTISAAQHEQAMNMCGYLYREPGPDAPDDCRQLWSILHACQFADAPCGPFAGPPADRSAGIAARKALRARVAAELDRLAQLDEAAASDPTQQTLDALEQHDRSESNLTPQTPEARLRQRYYREASVELRAHINQLMRVRADRRNAEDQERRAADRRPSRDPYPTHRHEPVHQPTETTSTPLVVSPGGETVHPFPGGHCERRTSPPTSPTAAATTATATTQTPANPASSHPDRSRATHPDRDEPGSWSNPARR